MGKIYITRASLFFHKYNKEYVLKLKVKGDELAIIATRNIKSEIAQVVLKEANIDFSFLGDVEDELDLLIPNPIGIEGVVFRAHVPPMYKYEDNHKIRIDTVEDFYSYDNKTESLEAYIYLKIRRVMRYRLFSCDSDGSHLYGVPMRKSLMAHLLEFHNKLIIDNDNYNEIRSGNDEPEVWEKYADTVIERFHVEMSVCR